MFISRNFFNVWHIIFLFLPLSCSDDLFFNVNAEVCDNQIDDDKNGLVDCNDNACINFTGCQEICGNDIREGTELCDGEDLGSQTCISQGFFSGILGCYDNCNNYDVSGCLEQTTCGNNILDPGEQCDGTDLGLETCVSYGFGGGQIQCINCEYNFSGCRGISGCGDNHLNVFESCDGEEIRGMSCEDFNRGVGDISCTDFCTIDFSACSMPNQCDQEIFQCSDGTFSCSGYDDIHCQSCEYGNEDPICSTNCGADGECRFQGINVNELNTFDCFAYQGFMDPDCTCGDGVLDSTEFCDGEDLGGVTSCEGIGFASGTIKCRIDCYFDLSDCTL